MRFGQPRYPGIKPLSDDDGDGVYELPEGASGVSVPSVETDRLLGGVTGHDSIHGIDGYGVASTDGHLSTALPPDPVTRYAFALGTGTNALNSGLLDASGTIDATWTANSKGTAGQVITLDGGSGGGTLVTGPNLAAYGTNEWTASLWVNADSLGGDSHAFGFYDTSTDSRAWRVAYNNYRGVWTLDTSTDGTGTNGPRTYSAFEAETDQWVCLTARYDGTQLDLFKNKFAFGSHLGSINANTSDLSIGDYLNGGQALTAMVDDFQYWGRALSDAEIRSHVEQTEHRTETNRDVQLPFTFGGWYWHGKPSAVHKDGVTVTGYVRPGGDINVLSYDHETGEWTETTIQKNILYDDHIHPMFLIRESDNRVVVFYGRGSRTESGYSEWFISDDPLDISSFGSKNTLSQQAVTNASYPKPVQFSDGAIYWFYRTRKFDGATGKGKEAFVVSNDGAETFGPEQSLIEWQSDSQWVYTMLDQHDDIVHIGTNDKDSGGFDSLPHQIFYFAYDYQSGEYRQADGTVIGTDADRPFDQTDLEVVYDGDATENNPAWIHDCVADDNGVPYITFSTYPNHPDGNAANYHWARWTGSTWDVKTVVSDIGPEMTSTQPLYTGGIVPSDNDPTTVWLSQYINSQWEIQTATTTDGGDTWSFTDVTSGSDASRIRPKPVKNAHKDIPAFWMYGRYEDPLEGYDTFMETPLTGSLSDTFSYR